MKATEVEEKIRMLQNRLGRFPMIREIASELGMLDYKVPIILKALVDRGFLIRVGNNYRIAPPHPVIHTVHSESVSAAPLPLSPQPIRPPESHTINATPSVAQIPVTPLSENAKAEIRAAIAPEKAPQRSPMIAVLRWMLLLIGVGAIVGSTFYTGVYLQERNPAWLAWLLSIIMVTFSTAAFDLIIATVAGHIIRGPGRWVAACGFFLLWIIVISFSITSTIAGQYNQYAATLAPTQRVRQVAQESRQASTDALAAARKSRDAAQTYLSQLIAAAAPASGSQLSDTAQYRTTLMNVNRAIQDQQEVLKIAQAEVNRLSAPVVNVSASATPAETERAPDFYDWVASSVFPGANAARIQFWMNLIPAVFLDLIAPTAIAIFLFARRKEEEK